MSKASVLTAALETAWEGIRERHPEIPAVVVVVGPVSIKSGKADRYGHYAPGRWTVEGERRHEVLISAEGLNRGARQVFRTLLHESVHASCAVRGIEETSRGGTYHNGKFRAEAEAFGLQTAKHPTIGCTTPDVTDAAAVEYAEEIAEVERALTLYRREELDDELLHFAQFLVGWMILLGHDLRGALGGDGAAVLVPRRRRSGNSGRNPSRAECGCGRTIRVQDSTFAEGPIICGICKEEFSLR